MNMQRIDSVDLMKTQTKANDWPTIVPRDLGERIETWTVVNTSDCEDKNNVRSKTSKHVKTDLAETIFIFT